MITRYKALVRVHAERDRQDVKWGYPQNNTPFEWVSILMEEVGELAEAVNDAMLGGDKNLKQAVKEAVHVSAVALAIVEHLSEEDS